MKPMKVKLLLLLISIFAFGSCNRAEKIDTDKQATTESVNIEYGNAESSRIIYYDNSVITTKAKEIERGMPEAPSNISFDFDMSINDYKSWKVKNNKSYYIAQGKSYEGDINLATNTIYYIEGEVTTNNMWGKGIVYVMPTGKLTINMATLSTVTIYNYGEIVLPKNITVNKGAELYTNKNFSCEKIHIGGNTYFGGTFDAIELQTSDQPQIEFEGCATLHNNLNLTNNGTIYVNSYLNAMNIDFSESTDLFLEPNAILRADKIDINNPSNSIGCTENDSYAVVNTKELVIKQQNVKQMFTGALDIHYKTLTNQSGKENLEWLSNIKLNGNTYIAQEGCKPEFGTPADPTPEKEYILIHLLEMSAPKEGISATCIKQNGLKAYVSWHTYGEPYYGYIDVVDIRNGYIFETISDPTADFNHIILDNNKLWTVGGNKKGAFLASINVELSGEISDNTLTRIPLIGASGNCVVSNGTSLITASGSNGGFESIDKLTNTATQEKEVAFAKHLNIQGNTLVALSGTESSKISLFDAQNPNFESPSLEFNIGNITPANGKNVCLVDGDVVYVAMGYNGVKAFRNGVEIAHFTEEGYTNGAANGIDFDDKYLYIANGNGGLVVLDKATFKVLKSYVFPENSANYVTIGADNVVYVAYGLNGAQAFYFAEQK